ncbi:MAG: hypothetical protein ACM3SV_11775 [Betaproteobacteria bacterium]
MIPLLAVLLLVAIATIGRRLAMPPMPMSAVADAGCNLQQSTCGASLPDGARMTLSILPHPIPLLKPLAVEVTTDAIAVTQVEVEFTGAEMNMGSQRVLLKPVAPGRFGGEATLPVCVTGRMEWQATVTFDSPQGKVAAPFRFFAPI